MRNGRSSFRCIVAIRSSIRLCRVTIIKDLSSKVPGTGNFPQCTFASWNLFRQRFERGRSNEDALQVVVTNVNSAEDSGACSRFQDCEPAISEGTVQGGGG